MQIKGLRIPVIVAIALLSIAMLISGELVYQHYLVRRPLVEKIADLPNVISVKIMDNTKPQRLVIKLGSVGRISDTVTQVNELVSSRYGRAIDLRLIDRRDEELNRLFESSKFTIYEALSNGNFTAMYAHIENKVNNYEIDRWNLSIDNQYIYLELHKGTNYLYEVIPRNQRDLVLGGDESHDFS